MKKIKSYFRNLSKRDLISYFAILGSFASIISILPTKDAELKVVLALIFLSILILNLIYQRLTRSRKVPIPSVDNMHFINEPCCKVDRVKHPEQLEKIVELAQRNYPCEINGYDFKHEMWVKNKHTFFVITNPVGVIKANINLLPLKQEAFRKLRDGKITEHELTSNDIYPHSHRDKVKYIYVEGLLAKSKEGDKVDTLSIYLIFLNFTQMIESLTTDPENTIICALGGSKEGINLMRALNFKSSGIKSLRKDSLDFYYIQFSTLQQKLMHKNISQVEQRFKKGEL